MPEWIRSIRGIVTLSISLSFCYLAIVGKMTQDNIMAVVMLVLGFYFVTKDREKHPQGK